MHIRDISAKVIQKNYKTLNRREEDEKEEIEKLDKNSELELLSNISSSTEIEQDTENLKLRRSKRLIKTNPIISLNIPVPSDHRKYSQETKRLGNDTGPLRNHRQLTTLSGRACPEETYNDRTIITDTARDTAAKHSSGRTTASEDNHIPPLPNSRPITEGGMKNNIKDKLP